MGPIPKVIPGQSYDENLIDVDSPSGFTCIFVLHEPRARYHYLQDNLACVAGGKRARWGGRAGRGREELPSFCSAAAKFPLADAQ